MPTVAELTALYSNFLLNPRPGIDVCRYCFNLTDGFELCYACAHQEACAETFAPISYSPSGGQLHHALAQYKRMAGSAARRLEIGLAAVLWRFLERHERCVALAAGLERFEKVTIVPSSDERRHGETHPLCRIVGETVSPTRSRYARLLARSTKAITGRLFDPERFVPTRTLSGESVLLIDDTWTTGSHAQSAAAALRRAGAGTVAVVVIGRHINLEWRRNDRRLRRIPRPFDWSRCALCALG